MEKELKELQGQLAKLQMEEAEISSHIRCLKEERDAIRKKGRLLLWGKIYGS